MKISLKQPMDHGPLLALVPTGHTIVVANEKTKQHNQNRREM
jgi:hypothetical protein